MKNSNMEVMENHQTPIFSEQKFPETTSIFLNAAFDKNHVKELVSWFLKKYGEKKTISFLESLKYIGFHQATQAGISLGIEDLEIPPEKPTLITQAYITTRQIEQKNNAGSLTSVEKSQFLIDTWNQTSDNLRQNAVHNFRIRNSINPVYMMAFSGARGNISQVRQLVAMRGLMADPQGAILEFPIQSNFREGLTITEYLISCYGARKGLVDTALRTATSGYLTRRLVDSAQQAIISMIDCGTEQGLLIDNKNLKNRLLGRILAKDYKPFLRNQLVSSDIAATLIKQYQQIYVRSPLTCEASTSVCQFCYGWNLASGKLVQIGEAVGVIAAQSIGEPGTQLTMRTFHTGGVGVFSDQALKPIFAPYSGKIIFEDSLLGHFVRTPYGQIVYMVKYTSTDSDRIIFRLLPFFDVHREFVVYEKDLPSGSLLLVKNGEIVNNRQLLAQASHFKLTKQKLPESSHPVYSPIEGQIFFESMNLVVEKEISNDTESLNNKLNSKNNIFNTTQVMLPDVRRMTKIGSFWIFSAFNQYEIHTSPCFIECGDLVSKNSLLFNYEFHSPCQIQIKSFKSKLFFGLDTFQIPINTISFSKNIYKFKTSKLNSEQVIYQKQTPEVGLLNWYLLSDKLDFSTNPKNNKFLYTHILPFYTQSWSFNNQIENYSLQVPKGQIFRVLNLTNFRLKKFLLAQQYNFQKQKNKKINRNLFLSFRTKNKLKTSPYTLLAKKSLDHFDQKNFIFNFIKFQIAKTLKISGWVYIPANDRLTRFSDFESKQFLPSGVCLQTICFPKQNLSVKKVNIELNFYKQKNDASIISLENTIPIDKNWYSIKSLKRTRFISHKKIHFFGTNFKNLDLQKIKKSNIKYQIKNTLQQGLIWYKRASNKTLKRSIPTSFETASHIYKPISQAILFQRIYEYTYPNKSSINRKISKFVRKQNLYSPNHFLFSKQFPSSLNFDNKFKFDYQLFQTGTSGWLSAQNLMCIQLKMQTNLNYSNLGIQFQTICNTLDRGLNVFQYTPAIFTKLNNTSFLTFLNNWVVPTKPFSSGIVKVKMDGEFRHKTYKSTGTSISILRNRDLIKIKRENQENYSLTPVGKTMRWGQQVSSEFISAYNGQIIRQTPTTVTIRVGIPILASTRGIVNVFQNDLVKQNQLLITLKSRRLQTEDIVQGIPKIEQLFEARESQAGEILSDTVHMRLRAAFVHELELLNNEHWSKAVEKSFLLAQQFLVENILEAYSNQGVKLAEKHVEVIVRQMTNRVRILEAGETGLLPGELVQHSWIQKFNKHIRDIGLREATYEPIVLGISKSVLQSDSFLLAASFQEVSRVLVRSALSKKRDFLRGLHENVIVGQLIPAGTGLLSQYTEAYPQLKTNYERR
jgi:hypothetical protein